MTNFQALAEKLASLKAEQAGLTAQEQDIKAKKEEVEREWRESGIAQVKAIMDEAGLTLADLQGDIKTRKKETKPRKAAQPKYKDPETGVTWTGRGISPLWIRGKEKAGFLIGAMND